MHCGTDASLSVDSHSWSWNGLCEGGLDCNTDAHSWKTFKQNVNDKTTYNFGEIIFVSICGDKCQKT